jgi:hypothetical protein
LSKRPQELDYFETVLLLTRKTVTATAAAIITPAPAKTASGKGGAGAVAGFTVACNVFECDNVPFVTVTIIV